VSPGDLVYVPRGQFHNARTVDGRSLHVTFGIEVPSGFDLAKRIVLELLADPVMRDYLPSRAADPEGQRARAWYEAIAERTARAASPEAIAAAREELQEVWVKKSGGGVQD
jgi:hypothetical protein